MTDTPIDAEGKIQPDIEEIVARFERLPISRTPRPPVRTVLKEEG